MFQSLSKKPSNRKKQNFNLSITENNEENEDLPRNYS